MSETANIEQRAAYWLMRRGEPDWSEAEQAEFDLWLDERMAHRAAFWRLEHGYAQADRIVSVAPALSPPGRPLRASGWVRLAMAASLVAAVAFGSYTLLSDPSVEPAQYATRVGQIGKLALADGSRVELNARTMIRVDQSARERTLWLDRGEVYFEVAHSRNRPFVIHVGSRDVTVLGTKFVIARTSGQISVSVVEGRVRLGSADKAHSDGSAVLTPGQMALVEGNSTLIRTGASDRIERMLAWRRGLVSFDQTTLADAAATFNRYNRKQLIIAPDVADLQIGGSFRLNNVEGFARLLVQAYGLHAEVREMEIRLTARSSAG